MDDLFLVAPFPSTPLTIELVFPEELVSSPEPGLIRLTILRLQVNFEEARHVRQRSFASLTLRRDCSPEWTV